MGPASPPVAGTFTATFPNISAPSQVTVTLSAGGSATSAVTNVRQKNAGPGVGGGGGGTWGGLPIYSAPGSCLDGQELALASFRFTGKAQ
jgi:hypothetical protein